MTPFGGTGPDHPVHRNTEALCRSVAGSVRAGKDVVGAQHNHPQVQMAAHISTAHLDVEAAAEVEHGLEPLALGTVGDGADADDLVRAEALGLPRAQVVLAGHEVATAR